MLKLIPVRKRRKARMLGCQDARMLGCSKANKHSISPYFRTSQLPDIETSKSPDFSRIPLHSQFTVFLQVKRSSRTAGPLLKRSAHLIPALSPPGLPAYSKILYLSLIAFSTSAGIYEVSSRARIFLAISLARVRVSGEPFSIHFSRLSWSETPLPP